MTSAHVTGQSPEDYGQSLMWEAHLRRQRERAATRHRFIPGMPHTAPNRADVPSRVPPPPPHSPWERAS